MKKPKKANEESMWSGGSFIQSMDPNDKTVMRTFHMKHDEEMNFNCKACEKKISVHNKDWHDGMCDDCFNKKYFKA
jgi:hypothetical protein